MVNRIKDNFGFVFIIKNTVQIAIIRIIIININVLERPTTVNCFGVYAFNILADCDLGELFVAVKGIFINCRNRL